MKKVLVVVRDIGAANMVGPLILLLRRMAHIIVVAEDKANETFRRAFGITPDYDARVDDLDASVLLAAHNPDLVIVGIGSPIKLELAFLREANKRGMRTVALEDFHGNHHRLCGERPELLGVLDEYAAMLVEQHRAARSTVIVGNSAIYTGEPSIAAQSKIDQLRQVYGAVYAFSSGETFSDVALVVECMKRTKGCLIPRLHPKIVDQKVPNSSATYGDRWRSILAPLGDRVVFLPDISSEHAVMLADGTLSGFSLLLYTASWWNKKVYALVTPEVMTSLHRQTGLSTAPIVQLGLAHAVNGPTDLAGMPNLHTEGLLLPYNPEKTANAVSLLLA